MYVFLCGLVSDMWWPILVHFIVSGLSYSVRGGVLSSGRLEGVSPVIFMNLL